MIEHLERAVGPAVATPEWITAGDGKLERAQYRVFRWRCPACAGGHEDPIYKPLAVNSDGRLWCEGAGCLERELAATIRNLTGSAA